MLADFPSKMRFQQAQKLAQEEVSDSVVLGSRNDEIISEKKKEQHERYARKHDCYTLDFSHKDALGDTKNDYGRTMLGLSVEEAVNNAVEASKDNFGPASKNKNYKAQYSRYVYDFLREDGGCTEKIEVHCVAKGGNKKQNKLVLNYFVMAFGASTELEFDVVEEGVNSESTYCVTLESGDAFAVNSLVKNLSYRVRQTTSKYAQKLTLRPGTLLI